MRSHFGMWALCLTVFLAADMQPGQIQSLARLYDYDSGLPLDVKETPLFDTNGVRAYDVSYTSPKGGRVTAYLVVPSGTGPFPAVLFGHWGPGTRTEFLPEATLYAEAGAVALLVDYPWVRPAPWRRDLHQFSDAEGDHRTYVQAVVDLRRGLDLLSARPEVDPRRLGYVGHSYGAQWGAILSAVDDRVKAAVLMGGVPDLAAILLESMDPDVVAVRAKTPKEQLDEYLRVNARTDAIHYVGHAAPTPLLFQFARHERYFDEAAMIRYAEAASEPKLVKWYHAGHELNDVHALLDRAEWLREHIDMGSLAPILRRELGRR